MRSTSILAFLAITAAVCSSQTPSVRSAVAPHYPPICVAARIAGTVSVRVLIDSAGTAVHAEAIEGPHLLKGASEEAAKLWSFEPAADSERTATLRFVYVLLNETRDAAYDVKFNPPYEIVIEKHPAQESKSYGAAGSDGKTPCFSIRVHLNGKAIDGPQAITLKAKENESVVPLEGGCFTVPTSLATEKALDIFFTLPRNKVYLPSIATGFFADSWDIDLEDKKFDSDVRLPKHARVREACAVVFHGGEPENALVQTGCRTPAPDSTAKD